MIHDLSFSTITDFDKRRNICQNCYYNTHATKYTRLALDQDHHNYKYLSHFTPVVKYSVVLKKLSIYNSVTTADSVSGCGRFLSFAFFKTRESFLCAFPSSLDFHHSFSLNISEKIFMIIM